MENKPEKIVSLIDHCLGDLDPHTDPDVIAEQAWNGLMESVEQGWLDEVEAEQMFYRWFRRERE